MGIPRKVKQVVTAPAKAVVKGVKALGDAVDPAKMAGRAVDEAVDSLKDDRFVLTGKSTLTIFGVQIGSLEHWLRATVEDKE